MVVQVKKKPVDLVILDYQE